MASAASGVGSVQDFWKSLQDSARDRKSPVWAYVPRQERQVQVVDEEKAGGKAPITFTDFYPHGDGFGPSLMISSEEVQPEHVQRLYANITRYLAIAPSAEDIAANKYEAKFFRQLVQAAEKAQEAAIPIFGRWLQTIKTLPKIDEQLTTSADLSFLQSYAAPIQGLLDLDLCGKNLDVIPQALLALIFPTWRMDFTERDTAMDIWEDGYLGRSLEEIEAEVEAANKNKPLRRFCSSKIRSVNLSSNALTWVPREFFLLPCLSELNLAKNKLGALPEEVVLATRLRKLDLRNNPDLTGLPESLEKNPGLRIYIKGTGIDPNTLSEGLKKMVITGQEQEDSHESSCIVC